ncbi:MAG: xanthine dehydrogenase family protein subunit M [Gemmatimonadaceae bacterium]
MHRFEFRRAATVADAVTELDREPNAQLIAGGTNLVDLMKYGITTPPRIIDITRLPLNTIEQQPDGGVSIGAMVTNADAAASLVVQQKYPLLASAILAGASGQLRNAATTGGNLLQRTRCSYFYDRHTPCNKREPGTGCPAIAGCNRQHAILGTSAHCIATHPSDMCVALAALDAVVRAVGPHGERVIAISDFHRLPGEAPERDTTLVHNEIVVAVELPPPLYPLHSYLKIRDRQSFAFALVSVAAAVVVTDNVISAAAIALGGVAHKPWRVTEAEALLIGRRPDSVTFAECAARLVQGAVGRQNNAFKITLVQRAIVRALTQATRGTPQSQSVKRVL